MLISKKNFFKGLALALALLMIVPAAVACADQDARQGLEEVKEQIPSKDEIEAIVREVLAEDPNKVTKDDLTAAINEATNGQLSAAEVEKIVTNATANLATQESVNNAIGTAIEQNNQQQQQQQQEQQGQQEQANDALIEAVANDKAAVAVIKEQYANNKADFSEATYAQITTLISVAETKISNAKTPEEADAILAKLNEDLAVYAPYGLSLYTKFVALNGKMVAGKTADAEDSYADLVAMQDLLKEAVAHYYAVDNATAYTELSAYVYAKDANNTDKTIDLITAVGGVTIAAGKATFAARNAKPAESQLYESKTVNSLQDQYAAKLDTALANAGKDVAKVIEAIGTASLSDEAQARIAAAEDAYKAMSDRFVTACKYTQVQVDAAIDNADAKLTDNVAVIATAKADVINLQQAGDALKYINVNGKVITEAYADFVALNIDSGSVNKYWADSYANDARALFTAIDAWATTYGLEHTPVLKNKKDFSQINYFFDNFEFQYWNYYMICADYTTTPSINPFTTTAANVANVTFGANGKMSGNGSVSPSVNGGASGVSANRNRHNGVNGAYHLAIKLMKQVGIVNAAVGTDVTKLDATMRTRVANLGGESTNVQKYAKVTYDSSKKYYTISATNTSIGISNSVAMFKAAYENNKGTDADIANVVVKYIGINAEDNGIAYAGYKTSSSDKGRFLIGFNQTTTEFMYSKYSVADAKMKEFADREAAIDDNTAISAQVARELSEEIAAWITATNEETGFDYTTDLATTTGNVNTKIGNINTRIDALKTQAGALETAIGNINKSGTAKQYDGTTNQTSAQLAQTDTLDAPQIDAAWAAYVAFVQAGGNSELKAETSKVVSGKTVYEYKSIVDNTKLDTLSQSKITLEECRAAGQAFIDVVTEFNAKLHTGTYDWTWYLDKEDDVYFLGVTKVISAVSTWVREKTLVAGATEIKEALAAFKALNHNEKYLPVENYLTDAAPGGYQEKVFAYIQAAAYELIDGATDDVSKKLVTLEVIAAAVNEDDLVIAVNQFNTMTNLGVALTVVCADFGF